MGRKATQVAEPQEVLPEEEGLREPQVIEKIVYKRHRVHGFFRTLTLIALLAIGFLMLGESMGIAKITIGNFALDAVYPIFIIFSTIVIRSYKGLFGKLFGLILFLGVFGGFFTIRIYNGLDEKAEAKFGEPIRYDFTGTNNENVSISTLIGSMEIEGNAKSPYLQGTWTSDREMIAERSQTGNQGTILLKDSDTLNLLQDFVTHLTLYIPSKTDFQAIYIQNARGKENISTQNLHRKKLTLHGGVNTINLNIVDVDPNAEIEIQGAVQNIILTIPKDVGVKMKYRQRLGFKTIPDMQYQTGYLYTSTNIKKAKKILNLNINIGIGKIKINRE